MAVTGMPPWLNSRWSPEENQKSCWKHPRTRFGLSVRIVPETSHPLPSATDSSRLESVWYRGSNGCTRRLFFAADPFEAAIRRPKGGFVTTTRRSNATADAGFSSKGCDEMAQCSNSIISRKPARLALDIAASMDPLSRSDAIMRTVGGLAALSLFFRHRRISFSTKAAHFNGSCSFVP